MHFENEGELFCAHRLFFTSYHDAIWRKTSQNGLIIVFVLDQYNSCPACSLKLK